MDLPGLPDPLGLWVLKEQTVMTVVLGHLEIRVPRVILASREREDLVVCLAWREEEDQLVG